MFFNMEKLGNQLAIRIADLYECHRLMVQDLPWEHTVAWIDYEVTDAGEIWKVSNDEYLLLYIQDAGTDPSQDSVVILEMPHLFFRSPCWIVGFTKSALRASYNNIADFHEALINVTLVIDQR